MHDLVLIAAGRLGEAALLAAGITLPALFAILVLAEQLQGLRRAEAQALVPAAWKRALAGSFSLRGKLRLPRRQRIR
jgi:hypothetical protein